MFGSGRNSEASRLWSRIACMAAAARVGAVVLAAPAAAWASDPQPRVAAYTLTPQRLTAQLGILVALVGAIAGWRALARAAARPGAGDGRRGAIVALVMGLIGLVIGGQVVAGAKGGLGTGQGLAGGVVAVVVGLIGMALGGLALARTRRRMPGREMT
ncbi:hypothetical protein AnaeK_3980 [Anaeromyxobacter sp. K]|uniref:DUF6223 family protein n=1 Tax=Anaeromyxobacter sp. (strain K) TaxID=447217 RepID=UPI00015F89BC|nr:DUF6223 family protein [Anaeromyxobacter sp. K]ACG75185.1 hypothetical protein AnaeK_3980 [Anaeromyxobacter sp. K]